MTTKRKKQLLTSYFIGITLTIVEVFKLYGKADMNFYVVMTGSLLVIVPWAFCLFDAAKTKDDGLLWFFFIFFIGGIGTPAYLLNSLSKEKKENTEPNTR